MSVRLTFEYSLNADCTAVGKVVVRDLKKPSHGTVTIEEGEAYTYFDKDNQRYHCNTQKSQGVLVLYQSAPGYTGPDSASIQVFFPTGHERTVDYDISVN